MTHPRQTIRESLVTLLTGLPLTGSRVYGSRLSPVEEGSLPALRIYADSEQASPLVIHAQTTRERDITYRIEIVARANADLDDALDAIAEQVEGALVAAADSTWLGGTLGALSTKIELSDDVSQPVGIARLGITINTFA